MIQSGVGFSMPILLGLTWGAVQFLTAGSEPTITPAEGKELWEAVTNLWYLMVIFPILGSGLAIWAHSLRLAYQQRDFTSLAAAGWNTYAQVSNTISAFDNVGGAFGNVSEFFGDVFSGDDDAKSKLGIVALLIVAIALVGGFLIAFGLVRHFARTSQSRLEAYAETLPRQHARAY